MNAVTTSRLLAGICVLAIAAPALAQDPANVVAQPEAAAPADPAAPVSTTNAQAAPLAPDTSTPEGAAAAAAAAASRELPQVLPTEGDGAVITTLLTNVCVPMVKGGNFEALAKANKLKLDRKTGEYAMRLGARPYTVGIFPPGNNPNVCTMRVRYAIGGDQAIIDGLNVWRFLHKPQLRLRRNDGANYPTVQRITTTWDNYLNQMIDGNMYGLVLVQNNKLDGSPSVDPKFDYAEINYAVRPPTEPTMEGVTGVFAPRTASGALVPQPAAPTTDPAAAPAGSPAPAAPADAAAGAVNPPQTQPAAPATPAP